VRKNQHSVWHHELEIAKDVYTEIDEVVHAASVNPQAALLLLSTKIEEQMRLLPRISVRSQRRASWRQSLCNAIL
jgi:hypothetical protein